MEEMSKIEQGEIPSDHFDEDSFTIVQSIDSHKATLEEHEQSCDNVDSISPVHGCLMDKNDEKKIDAICEEDQGEVIKGDLRDELVVIQHEEHKGEPN